MESKIKAFLDDLLALYEKHNISIAHEDYAGGFILELDSQYNRKWMMDATISDDIIEVFNELG